MTRFKSALWTTVSNGLTGLTTIIAAAAIQATGGTTWLGAWSVATAPLMVALAIERSIASQTLLRGASAASVPYFRLGLSSVAVGGGIVSCLLVYLFMFDPIFYFLAILVPLFVAQDALRLAFFGRRRPYTSAVSDAAWIATSAAIVSGYLFVVGYVPTQVIVIAYSAGGLVGFSVVALLNRQDPPSAVEHPRILALLVESAAVYGLGTASQVIVAAVVAVDVVGQVRLAGTITQPSIFVANLTLSLFVPRLRVADSRSVLRYSVLSGVMCAVVGFASLATVLIIPALSRLMKVPDANLVWTLGAILVASQALGAGLTIWLVRVRVHVRARKWLVARVSGAVSDPLTSVPAGALSGAVGLSIGPLVNNLVLLGFLTSLLSREPAPASRAAAKASSALVVGEKDMDETQ